MAQAPRSPLVVGRNRLFTILVALLVGVGAFMAGVGLMYAAQPGATPTLGSSAAPSASTGVPPLKPDEMLVVERVGKELGALRSFGAVAVTVFCVGVLLAVGAFAILLVRHGRTADKIKLGFALASIELETKDELRDAKEKLKDLTKRLKGSESTLRTLYALLHELLSLSAATDAGAFRTFLTHCAQAASAQLRADGNARASFWVLDAGGTLRILEGYKLTTGTKQRFTQSKASPGFAWRIVENGKPEILNAKDNPTFVKEDPDTRYVIAWMLGIPMLADEARGEVAGVLCISHDVEEEKLTQSDVVMASMYADLGAVALRLAELNKVALVR